MADLSKIVDELSSLTVLEAAELSKMLEERWGVSAAAPVAVAAAGGGGGDVTPYGGTAVTVPGTFQAENFDDYAGIDLVDTSKERGTSVASTADGAWVTYGDAALSGPSASFSAQVARADDGVGSPQQARGIIRGVDQALQRGGFHLLVSSSHDSQEAIETAISSRQLPRSWPGACHFRSLPIASTRSFRSFTRMSSSFNRCCWRFWTARTRSPRVASALECTLGCTMTSELTNRTSMPGD